MHDHSPARAHKSLGEVDRATEALTAVRATECPPVESVPRTSFFGYRSERVG